VEPVRTYFVGETPLAHGALQALRDDLNGLRNTLPECMSQATDGAAEFVRTRSEKMRTPLALFATFLTTSVLAQPQPQDNQTVSVGLWTIATTYKADKFDNCSMSRSIAGLGISFIRTPDGLLLLLDSPKWKLERGKAYSVSLVAGSQSVAAEALAETKGVTVALADRQFNGKLRSSSVLEVRGEGATLQVPLDGSSLAFERLEVS
jgi:hypothetical protein